jgi:hypothetical protein
VPERFKLGIRGLPRICDEVLDMACFLTRINVGDYETWKPMFDQDEPRAREAAKGYRIFRTVEKPGEVYLLVEFPTLDDARTGRQRLLASGVLNRFSDVTPPVLVEEAFSTGYS